ncbi:MAG TPA: ABC transporter ATP-binding protein [Balneolales bacterium]|nr:ABC transporter ATP-binding protein [Balneolales bacterium]
MNALELKNLSKVYKRKIRAVDNLSIEVPESSVLGLVGPNGAGKSTIMNILAGLLNKTEGKITILGQHIHKGDYEYKRKVGFVLEEPHYIEKLTVREYLHFCGAMYELKPHEINNRTEELLSFFRLEEKASSWIENCSTGMKKKVSLAAALIHQPQLLILDEPLEGIDPLSARQIKDNIRLMTENGITVVISSHQLDTIERFCDEVAIINNGKLIYQAKMDDIREMVESNSYSSLEELFVELVSEHDNGQTQKLSWL